MDISKEPFSEKIPLKTLLHISADLALLHADISVQCQQLHFFEAELKQVKQWVIGSKFTATGAS